MEGLHGLGLDVKLELGGAQFTCNFSGLSFNGVDTGLMDGFEVDTGNIDGEGLPLHEEVTITIDAFPHKTVPLVVMRVMAEVRPGHHEDLCINVDHATVIYSAL